MAGRSSARFSRSGPESRAPRSVGEIPTDDVGTVEPSFRERLWALFAVAGMIALRSPRLLLEPRLWAEEATIYYVYARHHDLLPSLFLVPVSRGPAGYLSLVPNITATAISRWSSEEMAPLFFTWVGFAFQLLPFALVLFGVSSLWRRAVDRWLVCALLLFCSTVISEVWLNTINSQIFLGLAAAILLAERLEPISRRRALVYRGVLVVGGLTGLYTAFLAPAFALKAWLERSRESLCQAVIVAVAALFQGMTFFVTVAFYRPGRDRLVAPDLLDTAITVFDHHVLRALLGQYWGAHLSGWLGFPAGENGLLALVLLIALVTWLAWRPSHPWQRPLLASYVLLLLLVSPTTSPSPPIHRYAALTGLLLLVNLWIHARHGIVGWRRRVSRGLVVVALVAGIGDYRTEIPFASLGLAADPPSWKGEVSRWRDDVDYMPRLWPFDAARWWRVYLPPPGERGSIEDPILLEGPLRLVSTGGWSEGSFELPDLLGDFQLVIFFESSQDSRQVQLQLRLEKDDGTVVAETPIRFFPQEQRHRTIIERRHLDRRYLDRRHFGRELVSPRQLERQPAARFDEVTRLTFAARALGELPVRVTLESIHLGPRIQGTYESLLPHLGLPRRLTPAPPAPAPAGGGTVERTAHGPSEWPARGLVTWLGPSGWVVCNLLALLSLAVLAPAHTGRATTPRAVLLWLVLLALSALPGWAFLASSVPLRALLLFLAVGRWLGEGQGEVSPWWWVWIGFASTVPIFESVVLLPLALAILADLGLGHRWRALGAWLVGAVLAAGLGFLSGVPLGLPGNPMDSFTAWLRGGWLLFCGADLGLLPLYPCALLAVLLFARADIGRRHLVLFSALVLVVALSALFPRSSAGSPGRAELAVLYPLFLLLPGRWPRPGRWLAAPLVAGLLWTLPVCQAVWHRADPEGVASPRLGASKLLPGNSTPELEPAGSRP